MVGNYGVPDMKALDHMGLLKNAESDKIQVFRPPASPPNAVGAAT